MTFGKSLLASALGTLLAIIFIILLFTVLIIASIAGSSKEGVTIKANSVLHLDLSAMVLERGNDMDGGLPSSFMSDGPTLALDHFIADIKRATSDSNIQGIFIEMKGIAGAPSSMVDVRRALEEFKASGKWILAYAEDFGQGGYYVSSVANEVYMYPQGSMDWRGINAEIMFFKKLLDKLEIEAQVIRGPNNKFKSAVEPYIYDHMTDENRAQMESFISDVWNVMLEDISVSRQVDRVVLNQLADSLSLVDPKKAVETKMLDGLKYRDEVLDMIKAKMGVDASTDEEDMAFITLDDYHKSDDDVKDNDNEIAVVYAVGAIESGEGDDQTIGSERIAGALRNARLDKDVKAIVLRVNSPGGSALASDVIWRETMLIKQSGKPFYVSMGDYAASGGYYISCAADKIYANPSTITGSIGVFGILPNMQKFLDNKLGLTFDRYETNPHADMNSAVKPLDELEMKAMQTMVSNIYNDFITKVATGRNMTIANVDSIGQGRVWSGMDAKQIGLVDELGNLEDCVQAIAAKAGIADFEVVKLPAMVDPFQKFVEELTGQKETAVLEKVFGAEYKMLRNAQQFVNMNGVQARLPFIMEIR
jgi:protease IV